MEEKKNRFISNIVNKLNWKLVVKTCGPFLFELLNMYMYLTALIIKKCLQVLELLKKINTN